MITNGNNKFFRSSYVFFDDYVLFEYYLGE